MAAVGETVEYTYCGQNTSTIPLTVVRLVDDRIGVVLEGGRVVAPGASLCNTDVGATASYVVQESDDGSVIVNNAVVTVRTQEDEPREFQQTAQTEVLVPSSAAYSFSSVTPRAMGAISGTQMQSPASSKATLGTRTTSSRPSRRSSPMDTTGTGTLAELRRGTV